MRSAISTISKIMWVVICAIIIFSVIYWSYRFEQIKITKLRQICQQDYNMTLMTHDDFSFTCFWSDNSSVKLIEIGIKK